MQLAFRDEGLVALHVYHHVEVSAHLFEGLEATVRAAAVIGGSHHGLAPEGGHGPGDALVVGGHTEVVEDAGGAFVDVLYYGFPAKQGQGLARESGRGIAGGDDCEVFHVN